MRKASPVVVAPFFQGNFATNSSPITISIGPKIFSNVFID